MVVWMQISRLFEIVYILLEKKSITASELAQRFEVSTRTIYRDIDILSGSGIPIYSSKGKGGGINILPDFVLNKSLLSEKEQNEILFSLQSLKLVGANQNKEVLSKLSGIFKKQGSNWLDVDFSHWGGGSVEREKFQTIKTGIIENRILSFVYYGTTGEITKRRVESVKLNFKNRDWYLQAFCLEKQDFRTFKVVRIENPIIEDTVFKPRNMLPPELDASTPNCDHVVNLKLKFTANVAYRVYDEFELEQIEKNDDGSFNVSVWYPEDNWVYSFLLSFGGDVKVEAPQHIRNIIIDKAKKILACYNN